MPEYRCTFCRSPIVLRPLRWFRRTPRSAQHLAGVTRCQETRVYASPAANTIEQSAQPASEPIVSVGPLTGTKTPTSGATNHVQCTYTTRGGTTND